MLTILVVAFSGCNSDNQDLSYKEIDTNIDTQEVIESIQNETTDNNTTDIDIIDSTKENIDENIKSTTDINSDLDDVNLDSNQNNLIEPYKTPRVSDINDSSNSIQNSHVDNNTDIKSRFLKGCSQVVDKEFFEVCYSYDLKVAKAVIYRLEGDLVNELNIKERPKFYEEEQLPQEYRAEYSDYTHSGYDRGHMAPDASFDWSIESLEATYSMANIIPQVPEVNRYGWANLEQYVRDMAVELGYVDVINVVEYGDDVERIGENKIGVSSGYYKILSNGDENYRECFYYENEEPQTDTDSVERHRVDCSIVR
jgi:endonuclease G